MLEIEKIINDICPNGVEYKPLWELTAWDKRFNGLDRSMQKKVIPYKYYLSSEFDEVEREDGDVLYISTGTSSEKRYTTEELAGEHLAEGEIVCIPWGGTPNVKYHKGKFVTGDNRIATSLDTNVLDNKFLYYWMQSQIKTIASFYRGAGIQHPSMKSVLEMLVPLPPLAAQREIVHVLDKFTLLSSELAAELAARRVQYEYYRNLVLNTDSEELNICSIEDVIISLKTGLNPRTNFKLNTSDSSKPYITGKDIYNNSINVTERTDLITQEAVDLINRRACLEINDILFASTGTGTVGRMAIIESYEGNWSISESIYAIKPDLKKIFPKFLMYSLYSSNAVGQYQPKITKASVPHLKVSDLLSVKINVPSIGVQTRIVEVLDNFDKICSDLKIGLPAEIEKRQQQYEYYRDKLLTFDNKSATIFDRQTDRQTDRQG